MSLLLEALKKAERAKEEAQRRAGGEPVTPATAPADAPSRLELQMDSTEPEAKPVMTKSQLPEISQGLEILTDDLAPGRAAPRAPAGPPPGAQGQARGAANGARPGTDASLERAAARKVFEAKFKESNPRMPFYITLGLLGVFGLCTVAYFWYQLRPPPPLVNTNPKPPANEKAITAIPAPSPAAAPAGTSAGQIAGLPSPTTVPGLAAAPVPAPAATPAPAAPAAAAAPRAEAPAKPAARAPRVAASPRPAQATPPEAQAAPARVTPRVESAYAAYLAGNVASARAEYQEALREDPSNRDALLGLAASEVRSGRFDAAEGIYLRLLQADPRDAHAQAGLIALRSGRVDPVAAESRVKSLLAADPGSHVLYFTLGNQLAQQERWAEAQQQYFKAFVAEPENADFAYNLAVSLDHLRQPKLALEYYQRAVALAEKRGASFDLAAARQRAAQLGK